MDQFWEPWGRETAMKLADAPRISARCQPYEYLLVESAVARRTAYRATTREMTSLRKRILGGKRSVSRERSGRSALCGRKGLTSACGTSLSQRIENAAHVSIRVLGEGQGWRGELLLRRQGREPPKGAATSVVDHKDDSPLVPRRARHNRQE